MSRFSNWRSTFSNSVVNLGRGTTPHASIDSPRAFRLAVAVALVAVSGSIWLVSRNIRIATQPPSSNANTSSAVAQLNSLKQKDTDRDGLSDYDELFTAHTSPYLKDSDGDGISDKQELDQGTNPNCPQGEVCSSFSLLTSPVDANGNLTPSFLRQALKAAGVPQAQLDKTDDEALIKIYQNVVGQSATNTNQTPTTNQNTNASSTTSLNQFNNLSSSEIRSLLIQNGVDQATLNSVDDATLMKIFQQAAQTNQ